MSYQNKRVHIGCAQGAIEAVELQLEGKKPVLAVASGGMYPGLLEKTHQKMGNNILYQFGAGVHAHRHGTEAGARAIRQACESLMKGESLKKAAQDHKELAVALNQWGY